MASTREACFSVASAASSRIAKANAELRQVRTTISTQRKELAKTAQLKTSIQLLKDNVAFYEETEDRLKSELPAATIRSTQFVQLFDDVCAELGGLRERLGERVTVIRSIVEDSCATQGHLSKAWLKFFLRAFISR